MHRLVLPSALSFALATTLVGSLAFAQAPQAAPPQAATDSTASTPVKTPNPHHQAMQLAKQLNLTPDQTARLEPILADRDQKIAALRADTSLDPKSVKKQMHALQQNTQQQMSSVLTPAQLEQLKSLHHGQARQPLAPPPSA